MLTTAVPLRDAASEGVNPKTPSTFSSRGLQRSSLNSPSETGLEAPDAASNLSAALPKKLTNSGRCTAGRSYAVQLGDVAKPQLPPNPRDREQAPPRRHRTHATGSTCSLLAGLLAHKNAGQLEEQELICGLNT